MTWEEWCKAYPARDAKLDDLAAKLAEGPFDTQVEAEQRSDWLQTTHERGGFEVIRFQEKFYIIG